MAQVTGGEAGAGGAPRTAGVAAVRPLVALALPALTTLLGLQVLRFFIPTLYFYLGEVRGVSTVNLGVVALALFGLAFLAGLVRRLLGPRPALAVTAGGVALMRLAVQLIPAPAAGLALGAAGTVLFLWFLPIYLGQVRGRGGQATAGYAQAILLGLALDAGIQGAAGTVDLVWQPGAASTLAVLLLAGLQLLCVVASWRTAPPAESDGRLLPTLALAGLGPFLVLQAMCLGNTAVWAVQTGWPLPAALGGVLLSYALALAVVARLAPRLRRRAWPWLLPGTAAFVLLAALPQRGALAALALATGQILAAAGLLAIFSSLGEQAGRRGLWRSTVANGVGMLLFVIGVFLYYASYWIHLPLESSAVLPGAAVLFGLGVLASAFGLPRAPAWAAGPAPAWAPAWAAAALLVVPLALGLSWRQPGAAPGRGWPVRVMSYNLHNGFNTGARLDLEGMARNIEASGAEVVGLQEVTRGWYLDGSPDMAAWLARRLGMPYIYTEAVDPYFGNAILSRFPIKEQGRGSLPRTAWEMRRSYIWARLDLGAGEEMLFVTAHTHHVYPGQGEIRLPQMAVLARFWAGRPRTVIVGDLNAHPADPEIVLFATAGLRDAFVQAGSGDGFTQDADHPHQRIDYIWLSPDLQAADFRIIQSTASDHLPVFATVGR